MSLLSPFHIALLFDSSNETMLVSAAVSALGQILHVDHRGIRRTISTFQLLSNMFCLLIEVLAVRNVNFAYLRWILDIYVGVRPVDRM